MGRALWTALVLAVGVVLVAGCGADDEETPTKAEFVASADELCEESNERIQADAKEFTDENGFEVATASDEQLETFVRAVYVTNLEEQVEELAALDAPQGDQKQVDALVVSLEGAAARIAREPMIFFRGTAQVEARRLASDYGFKVCGG